MTKINVRGPGKFKIALHLKVRQLGDGFYVPLPKPFCVQNNISKGDPVAAAASKNVLTLVFPPEVGGGEDESNAAGNKEQAGPSTDLP